LRAICFSRSQRFRQASQAAMEDFGGKPVDIATKYQGRIAEVLAGEGDTVEAGQVVAKMDVEPLEAQFPKART